MDEHIAKLIAAVARVEEGVRGLDEKLEAMRQASIKRLDNHAERINSLEASRDKRTGAARLSLAAVGILGSLGAYFIFWR